MNVDLLTKRSTHNRDGKPQATDESSSSESTVSEEAQSRFTQEKSTQEKSHENTDNRSKGRQSQRKSKQAMAENVKGYLNKDYRDLLNSTIEQAAGAISELEGLSSSSYVGSSYWAPEEKEAFFCALAIRGQDDLPTISKAIQTKSLVEVRSYLLVLQNACANQRASSPCDSDSTSPSSSIACEIGERCEHAINLTADLLERHVHKRDIERERQRFGDIWLIDSELASKIESNQQQKSLAMAIDDDEQVVEISDDSSSESEPEDRSPETQAKIDTGQSVEVETIESANLLKPEAFIQLSRSLFMNSAVDLAANWAYLGADEGEQTTPAMFRSAFDSFYTITVNLTRWIVQATMFQATSRLRAKDEQDPTAVVTTEDVKVALDFLNLKADWKKHWAGIARRNGVEVYSESDKYRDGRPGTKNGRLLTYDEVEAELGFAPIKTPTDGMESEHKLDGESSSATSSDESDQISDSSEGSSDGEQDMAQKDHHMMNMKRKRIAEPSSDEDEDERLNIADKKASRAEERRLLKMLRLTVSASPEPEAEDNEDRVDSRAKKRIKSSHQENWRSRIDYKAAWEPQRIEMEKPKTQEG